MTVNPEEIRQHFPIFRERPELAYLDNAATSQKPGQVIQRIREFYEKENSNVGRGIYKLASEATQEYAAARETIADFVGARKNEIVFVRGCTEGINLLASSLEFEGKVLVPESSHHSEMLPWRKSFGEKNIEYIKVESGKIDLEDLRRKVDQFTVDLISISHISNVYGTKAPVKKIVEIAHQKDALVVLDAAQSVPHLETDFRELGVDFAVFSGHKMLGPTGIGGLYGKKKLLDDLPPYQVGGGMIQKVEKHKVNYESAPERFEAGTPNIAGAIGMAEAAKYLSRVGRENIHKHEKKLCKELREGLKQIEGIKIISPDNASIVSFSAVWAHPHDLAEVLNQNGIAVRAGHHCAQPEMESIGLSSGTVRISPYLYNTKKDIQRTVEAVKEGREVFN